jgi:hypothetical protein
MRQLLRVTCPPKTGGGNREFSYDIGIRAEVASIARNFFEIFATVTEYAVAARLLFPVTKQFCATQRNVGLSCEQKTHRFLIILCKRCDP